MVACNQSTVWDQSLASPPCFSHRDRGLRTPTPLLETPQSLPSTPKPDPDLYGLRENLQETFCLCSHASHNPRLWGWASPSLVMWGSHHQNSSVLPRLGDSGLARWHGGGLLFPCSLPGASAFKVCSAVSPSSLLLSSTTSLNQRPPPPLPLISSRVWLCWERDLACSHTVIQKTLSEDLCVPAPRTRK